LCVSRRDRYALTSIIDPAPAAIELIRLCRLGKMRTAASCPRSIVVLTGAGVSAESGIVTFRAAEGLWEEHRIEDVASPEGFARKPRLVHDFYNQRRRHLLQPEIRPNAAHLALAEFERDFDGEFLLVSQNIDDLHERAGSRELRPMHGELLKIRCQHSGRVFEHCGDVFVETSCPCCDRTGALRPDITWFGEIPMHIDEIFAALDSCDVFVAIGTSGHVYPAAGFHQAAKAAGATAVELNLECTGSGFDHGEYGPATEVVPQFFSSLLMSNFLCMVQKQI